MKNISGSQCREDTFVDRKRAVERVIANISRNLNEPINMDEMAKIAYLSPFHFNRIFHDVTGLPPSQFLYAMRLQEAKRLLLTTTMNVTDICFEVGYNSLGTFTRRFTELVGLPPTELRRFAGEICKFDWERLYREGWKENVPDSFISGELRAPENFEGLIFIGLFEKMIPQSSPVSGTLVTRACQYKIKAVNDGTYYLLVAALPRSVEPLDYLLMDLSKLLVGVGETPIIVKKNKVKGDLNIAIRPLRVTDPPILTVLPLLLIEGLKQITSDK